MENLGIVQLREKLLNKELTPLEIVDYYIKKIEEKDGELNSYITVCKEEAREKAKNIKSLDGKLTGIPFGIKDVFTTKGIKTTCASNILNDYIPSFESTVTQRLLDDGAIILGKTNLDQFCHGSSTITSFYGPTRNPHDLNTLPGGSSGGSAAATAADLCAGSLGTETAGSIRLPASWCGVVGLKPTYGRVSRYGVLAMGSSLDSPGPIVKSVEDAAYLLSIIAGYDKNDFTSSKEVVPNYFDNLSTDSLKGLRVAIPKEYMELDLEGDVRKNFEKSIKILKDLGVILEEVSIMDPKFAMAVYTVSCRSEVSSNLARYDGTRYGLEGKEKETIQRYFESTRGDGFGEEAKRRIMTGTFSLSAGYADEFYKQSEKVRQLIREDFDNIFKTYDAIVAPTTPSVALKDVDAINNPLFGEMADVLAEGSSEVGLPGLSIPSGFSGKLPTGIQFIGKHFDEQTILNIGYGLEQGLK
jgi:aspartyl-tRNA(Asn)/glutamyl-tRNA(Gln) amidotransferase subunit A